MNRQTYTLFDISFFSGTFAEAVRYIEEGRASSRGRAFIVCTPNTEHVMLASKNPAFLTALHQADLCLPDGSGVVHAANLLAKKQVIRERITGREMMAVLLEYAAQHHHSVFLLGGKDDVAQGLARTLKKQYPNLVVTADPGAAHIATETAEEEKRVLTRIATQRPDLLFVAYGAPWQELWLTHHAGELARAGVKVAMAVGGSFDVLSGRLRACPKALSVLGLEWLWRLIQEPWRWRRQLVLIRFWGKVVGRSGLF